MLTPVQRGGPLRRKPGDVVRGNASRLPWAWDGLCFAAPFNDATRDSARDLVWGAAPSAVSNLTWTHDNLGDTAANLVQTSYVTYPDNPAHNRPTTTITVYARFRRGGDPPNNNGGILTKRYGASDPWLSWGLVTDATSTMAAAHLTVNGTWYYWETAYTFPTTEYVNAFLRWRSGTAPQLDVLGDRGDTRVSLASVSSPSGSVSYSTGEPITFNSTENNLVNFNADYSQGMLWSRYLTDGELQALVADPYGWYSPRRETIGVSSPYPLVAGAGEMRTGTASGGLS